MTTYVWYFIRATGTVAYLLLYASVMVGLFSQVQKKRRKKVKNTLHLHEALSNWALILVTCHLVFLFFDTYLSFQWFELFLPFTTDYKPFPMAIGTFSFYILLITFVTTKLRKKIGIQTWRKLHMLTPFLYIFVTAHALLIGTDFQAFSIFILNMVPLAVFLWLLFKRYDTGAVVKS
ncbi:ferric reductase-like transmembrane domain-containing protein [Bacillus sp. 165]|uniref:ferric reductase-like transmembrane domain-containing protein n=1 Tax=Bacillus sp. 165 TaxID=1529117 RepID=UPI001ADA9B8B|nr:ferric reductase-like transmembrane domain-containing protein [Bacillus sp. 165]MBO9129403.1 ferric reductase-like transmembrane domain-containing protein [Bacillus sp. 165]